MKPLIKWVGGKTQLLPVLNTILEYDNIKKRLQSNTLEYVEPFFGGGALYFDLYPVDAWVNDANSEIINFYIVVRDKLEALYNNIQTFNAIAERVGLEKFYYHLREHYTIEHKAEYRAARFWYLNQTCFNGLYRVNKAGIFNVPFNKRHTFPELSLLQLEQTSKVLHKCRITNTDALSLLSNLTGRQKLIYIDPPYIKTTQTSFTKYTQRDIDHAQLAHVAYELSQQGHYVVISNSSCAESKELYTSKGFKVQEVEVRRAVNSNGNDRKGQEIIATNF